MDKIPQVEEEIKQSNINPLYELLRSDGSIIINKALAHAIGLHEAILFAELISRFNYFAERGQLTAEGYFFNTIDDLQSATGLSAKQQKNALNKLQSLKLLHTKLQGMPAKRHFKIADNLQILGDYLIQGKAIMKQLKDYTKPESLINQQFGNISETGLAESAKQDSHIVLTNNTKVNDPKCNEEAEAKNSAAFLNISKADQVVTVYAEQLELKGLTPVHKKEKLIKQYTDSPLTAVDEKQVIAKLKSWFKTADNYTVGQGYPMGLFIRDYNAIAKPQRVWAGICEECDHNTYEDEEHICKQRTYCYECETVVTYTGRKRDEEILQQHVCNPEALKYQESIRQAG